MTFYHLCRFLSAIGGSATGRRLLARFYPETRNMTDSDWSALAQIVRAHDYVHRRTNYIALTLEKPL